MSYLYVLERIEEGRISVKQAIQEIERETKRRENKKAKKIKIHIVEKGRLIRIPSIYFGMIKVALKVCPPFINFVKRHSGEEIADEEMTILIENVANTLDLMRDYPPLEIVNVKSQAAVVQIVTK